MAEKYKIGRFEFDTEEDYRKGLYDVKKIRYITKEVDIHDPDAALRLYNLIKTGKIQFYSKIGKRFFLQIVDIVAKNSKEQEKEKKNRPEFLKPVGKQVDVDKTKKTIGLVCLASAIICFVWYFWSDYTNHRGNQQNEYLKSLKENSVVSTVTNQFFNPDNDLTESTEDGQMEESRTEESHGLQMLPEYQAIYAENQDFIGWLTIDGTAIDYPVMQTPQDNTYYLSRNFNGEDDTNGTLFLDARDDIVNRSTNFIIYGHNMKSGQMFGDLKNYQDESYWQEHKQIEFDTLYEKSTYEIIAVCLAQVEYQDEDVFKYYDFIQADSEEEFNNFIWNVSQMSVLADSELAGYGDELLTLSTCNNYIEDGRLFLVAKKCKDAE